jgi:hypothetical protein
MAKKMETDFTFNFNSLYQACLKASVWLDWNSWGFKAPFIASYSVPNNSLHPRLRLTYSGA